jgi:hypothetical protein
MCCGILNPYKPNLCDIAEEQSASPVPTSWMHKAYHLYKLQHVGQNYNCPTAPEISVTSLQYRHAMAIELLKLTASLAHWIDYLREHGLMVWNGLIKALLQGGSMGTCQHPHLT